VRPGSLVNISCYSVAMTPCSLVIQWNFEWDASAFTFVRRIPEDEVTTVLWIRPHDWWVVFPHSRAIVQRSVLAQSHSVSHWMKCFAFVVHNFGV
jgi:hypothetical protein